MPENTDTQVRLAAFAFLEEQTRIHGDVLPKSLLEKGFVFKGERVLLLSPQGIFKPRILDAYPLTFTTVPPSAQHPRPYEDDLGDDGVIRYRYRGSDPQHPDNVGLRRAMHDRIPLIYFFGVVPGQYYPVWPVFIATDDPGALTFGAVAEERSLATEADCAQAAVSADKRRYITVEVQRRLHQRGFRERILIAYANRCAVCQLHHPELLDAAHILPDGHPEGKPIIPNGLSLCTLHHAAYDQNILGINPDFVVRVRDDILREADGPMLRYGLQATQGVTIKVPRANDLKPNRDYLSYRYELFLKAG